MFHVYVLRSQTTGHLYTGQTEDMERRLAEHNSNLATATKRRGPWDLIYRETYQTRSEAMRRERYLKTGRGREELRELLRGAGRKPHG
jgi:putative endonuclease